MKLLQIHQHSCFLQLFELKKKINSKENMNKIKVRLGILERKKTLDTICEITPYVKCIIIDIPFFYVNKKKHNS